MNELRRLADLPAVVAAMFRQSWNVGRIPLAAGFFSGSIPSIPTQQLRADRSSLHDALELVGIYYPLKFVMNIDNYAAIGQLLGADPSAVEQHLVAVYASRSSSSASEDGPDRAGCAPSRMRGCRSGFCGFEGEIEWHIEVSNDRTTHGHAEGARCSAPFPHDDARLARSFRHTFSS